MPRLVQGVTLMLISGVKYWDYMDVEWITMLAKELLSFLPCQELGHHMKYMCLRRVICADRYGNGNGVGGLGGGPISTNICIDIL